MWFEISKFKAFAVTKSLSLTFSNFFAVEAKNIKSFWIYLTFQFEKLEDVEFFSIASLQSVKSSNLTVV